MWGVSPVYFVIVAFAQPLEVLAYRVLWSLPLLMLLTTIGKQWAFVRSLDRRTFLRLALCAFLLSINWLVFIYAIQQGRIAETSLGYYINPLMSIALGALVLGERMRKGQWLAVACAALGVAYELFARGELPWYGLSLAASFAVYGLVRRQIQVPAAAGLGIETGVVAPVALLYLIYATTTEQFPDRSVDQLLLLGLGGVVTALPLLCFGAAASRLPLTLIGFFQYIAPTISLVIAVWFYGEEVSTERWWSFALIWLGLLVFSIEGVMAHRSNRKRFAMSASK